MYAEAGLAVEAFRLGAVGFVLKRNCSEDLATAIDAVMSGGTHLAVELRNEMAAMSELGAQSP